MRSIVLSNETNGVDNILLVRPGRLVHLVFALRVIPSPAATGDWSFTLYAALSDTQNSSSQNYLGVCTCSGTIVAAAGAYTAAVPSSSNLVVPTLMPYGERTTLRVFAASSGVSSAGFSVVAFVDD